MFNKIFNNFLSSAKRLFGGRLQIEILRAHPELDFLNKWLRKIDKIYDLKDMTFEEWTKYYAYKIQINKTPNHDDLIDKIAAESKKFIYRLVHDFFDELKEPFFTERTVNAIRNLFTSIFSFSQQLSPRHPKKSENN